MVLINCSKNGMHFEKLSTWQYIHLNIALEIIHHIIRTNMEMQTYAFPEASHPYLLTSL